MEKRKDLITGIWKFKDTVKGEDLNNFAEELANDSHYMHVYIRKVSKDQYGIGITFVSDEQVTEEYFDKYMEESKDTLYRKFGTGLAGWDFANTTITFKGF